MPIQPEVFSHEEIEMDQSKVDFYDTVERIVARAWVDADFKSRLMSDPSAATTEMGLVLKPGVQLNVVEDSHEVWNLVIPHEPPVCSADHLEVFAAAGSSSCGRCRCISACCG
jgi:Nitrile hydratase, alpha chain